MPKSPKSQAAAQQKAQPPEPSDAANAADRKRTEALQAVLAIVVSLVGDQESVQAAQSWTAAMHPKATAAEMNTATVGFLRVLGAQRQRRHAG